MKQACQKPIGLSKGHVVFVEICSARERHKWYLGLAKDILFISNIEYVINRFYYQLVYLIGIKHGPI